MELLKQRNKLKLMIMNKKNNLNKLVIREYMLSGIKIERLAKKTLEEMLLMLRKMKLISLIKNSINKLKRCLEMTIINNIMDQVIEIMVIIR